MVVNLESSIAVTQNFVSRTNLAKVLRFLRERPEQVSGFGCGIQDDGEGLQDESGGGRVSYLFEEALRSKYPHLYAAAHQGELEQAPQGEVEEGGQGDRPSGNSSNSLWSQWHKPTSESLSVGFTFDFEA